ncbi:MAG: DUF4405 domain-containing protein [Actinobacteria bacterium]|nr:DUF4405 domain-containing protein [Actinomycetota bacterium]
MSLKIKLKVIVDIFLMLAMIVSAVTGILLLLGLSGPGTQAGISGSLFDFTSRSSLKLFHDWSSILLIILVVFHLMLNWNIIVRYIRSAFVVSRK